MIRPTQVLVYAVLVLIAIFAASSARADLLINVSPSTVTIPAGQSGTIMIESQPQPGFPSSPPASRIEYSLLNFTAGTAATVSTPAPAYPPVQMTIEIPSSTAPGTYRATIRSVVRDAGGAMVGDKDFPDAVTVIVPPPAVTGDYSVTVAPNPIVVRDGRQRFTFTLTSTGGFSGTVSVSMGASGQVVALDKNCAPGSFCPFTERPYTVPAGGSVSDEAIASTTGPNGGTIVIVTKSAGLPDKSTSVDVPPQQQGGFTIAATPSALTVRQDTAQDITLTLTRTGGFAGPVTVTAYPVDGTSITPNPVTFAAGETMRIVRLTVTRAAQPATTTFSFVGSSPDLQNVSHSASVTLTVTPAEQPDFTVTVTPPALTLAQGASNPSAATITINRSGGFTGPVNVTLAAPAGVTLSESSFSIGAGQTSRTVGIRVDDNAALGSSPITITATAPEIPRTVTTALQLTVAPAAAPATFTLSAAPLSLTVTAGKTADVTLTVTRQNFTGVVAVTAAAQPAGLVVPPVSFGPNETTRVVTIQALANTSAGPGSIEFTGTAPDLPTLSARTASVAVTVVAEPVGATPLITALMPPGAVSGTQSLTLLMSGENFASGAIASSSDPRVIVESTRVLLPTLAEVVVSVPGESEAGRVRLDLRNPTGRATSQGIDFLVYEPGDIGAPLGVTSAAILSPLSGRIIGPHDRPHAVGAIAATGTGTITGRWLFDDGTFDAFTITVAAGEPTIFKSKAPIPASYAGTHRLQLVIDSPQYAQAAVVRLQMTAASASALTILGPIPTVGDRATSEDPMMLRWSMVPGALAYHVELEKNGERFGQPIAVGQEAELRLEWEHLAGGTEPSPPERAEIRAASWRWRVAPVYCCAGSDFYPGEYSPWAELRIPVEQVVLDSEMTDAAIAEVLTEDLHVALAGRGRGRMSQSAAPPSAGAPAPARKARKDFVIMPMVTSTYRHGSQEEQGSLQFSGQGDLGFPPLSSKYTADFTGTNLYGDEFSFTGSRSWIANIGNAKRSTAAIRPEAIVGYAPPDFFSGTQLVTSSFARGGGLLRVGSRYGSLAYYSSLTDELDGVWSGNFGMRQKLQAAAYELPSNKRYSLKILTMHVEDLPSDSGTSSGGEGRSIGLLGSFNMSPMVQITAEAALGEGEWRTRGGLREREGGALRVALSGNRKRTSYRLDLNHTDGDFVNPGSRGYSSAAIPNRTGGSVTLTNSIGKGSGTFTLRHQVQSRSTSSAHATGLNASYSLPVRRGVMLTASGNYNADRGDADSRLRMPRVERDQFGATVTLTESVRRLNFSQTLAHQQLRDDVHAAARNDTDTLTLTGGGTLSSFLQMSASATITQSSGARLVGDTDSLSFSLQPTITIPRLAISLQPRIGYHSSDNGTTRNRTRGEQYAATMQWNPPWLHKLAAMQLSANWDRSKTDTAASSRDSMRRTYAGTFTLRWGAGIGPAFFRAMAGPGEVPPQTQPVSSANPVNGRTPGQR